MPETMRKNGRRRYEQRSQAAETMGETDAAGIAISSLKKEII
jgi:hypothetical protein